MMCIFFSTQGCLLGLSGQDSPNDIIRIGSLNPVGQNFETALRRNDRFSIFTPDGHRDFCDTEK